MMEKWKVGYAAIVMAVVAIVLVVWGSIDGLIFRFSHVDYSETRLFLENWDAYVMVVVAWVLTKIASAILKASSR